MEVFILNEKGTMYLKSKLRSISHEMMMVIIVPVFFLTLNTFFLKAPVIVVVIPLLVASLKSVFDIISDIRHYQRIITRVEVSEGSKILISLEWTLFNRNSVSEVRRSQAFDYFEKKQDFNNTFGAFCRLGKEGKTFFLIVYDYYDKACELKEKLKI